MEKMKTLLRYPGGKSRAVKVLMEHIPKDIKEVCSPFFGGGSLEIALANNGVNVKGYDAFLPLVEFWQEAIHNPIQLSEECLKYFPLKKEEFYEIQKQIEFQNDKLKRAAMFYVLNRSSFSGSTLSGGMSPGHPRFTNSSIERLREFKSKNISVEHMDFSDSIKQNKDVFLYLDPPYLIKSNLYGKKGDMHADFDHNKLFELIHQRNNWLLSYNDCEEIREKYKAFKIIEPQWSYGMSKNKTSKEILIINS